MAWLRPEHGRRRMLSELLLCWTLCLAGLVASRVNIAIIYPVSTTQQSSDGDMPWICTSHLQLDATFNDPRCKWKWHFYAQQLLQHVAMLVWTIPASVMNSWCFGEVTPAPPAAALQSHCCEGKMSHGGSWTLHHNNTSAETLNNDQESTFNIVCVDIKNICSMFSVRKLH